MKTKLFIAAAFIQILSIVNVSGSEPQNIWYGPKIGLDLSTSTRNFDQLNSQLESNYQIGGFMQFGKKLFFQPEAYFASYKLRESNQNNTSNITFMKIPLMLGYKFFNIGLISLHLSGGPTYTKEISGNTDGSFRWEFGAGACVLSFITADLRYTFKNNDQSGIAQMEELIANGGMVNLTVGIKLRK
ncbi:MAG: porin family protein [Paludibacteraceae bacterium]|nr:porin family protein [Paludibacteraceae bacterium]